MEGDPAELALAIRQVTLAVQRFRLRAARAGLDVGANEMMALAQLFTVGPCSPTELAAFLSMTTASVTNLLDRLQRAEHVVRRAAPQRSAQSGGRADPTRPRHHRGDVPVRQCGHGVRGTIDEPLGTG